MSYARLTLILASVPLCAALTLACTPDRNLDGKSNNGGGGNNAGNNGVFNNAGNEDLVDRYGQGTPVTTVPGFITVDQFANVYSDVFCGKLYQCEDEAGDTLAQLEQFLGFSDEASCKNSLGALFGAAVQGQVKDAINKNRARWDGNLAGRCLQNVNVVACAAFSDGDGVGQGLEDCENILIGQQEIGEECGSDPECKDDDSYCNGGEYDLQSQRLTLGVCAELGRDGDPCEWDDDCASTFYCEWNGGENSVCRGTPQPGEPCTGTCTEGYTCAWNPDDSTQTCQTEPREGEPCNGTCADDLFCDYSLEQPVCKQRPGEGERCTNECDFNLVCSANTCQDQAMFDECSDRGECPEGFVCGNNWRCVEPGM